MTTKTIKRVVQFQGSPGVYHENWNTNPMSMYREDPLSIKAEYTEAQLTQLEKEGEIVVERLGPDGSLIPKPQPPSYQPPQMDETFLKNMAGQVPEADGNQVVKAADKQAWPVVDPRAQLNDWIRRVEAKQAEHKAAIEQDPQLARITDLIVARRKTIGDPPQLKTSTKRDGPGLAKIIKRFFTVKG